MNDLGVWSKLVERTGHSIVEANAHAADEHVRLSDLKGATQVVAATLRELLGSRAA